MQQRFIKLHPKTKINLQNMALESAQDSAYRVSNRIKAILLNHDGKSSSEIDYHPGHVRKLLAEFGYSVQSPKRLLAAADKEKRDKWVLSSYQHLKKRPAHKAVV